MTVHLRMDTRTWGDIPGNWLEGMATPYEMDLNRPDLQLLAAVSNSSVVGSRRTKRRPRGRSS